MSNFASPGSLKLETATVFTPVDLEVDRHVYMIESSERLILSYTVQQSTMATTTTIATDIEISPDPTRVGQQPSTDPIHSQPAVLHPIEVVEPATEGQDADADYPKGFKFGSIVLSLSLVLILVGLDANILATAVP
jgi:hypothetical protein